MHVDAPGAAKSKDENPRQGSEESFAGDRRNFLAVARRIFATPFPRVAVARVFAQLNAAPSSGKMFIRGGNSPVDRVKGASTPLPFGGRKNS